MIRLLEKENYYEDYIYELAKIRDKDADKKFGDFGDFIYYSPKIHPAGSRVKFPGGTKESNTSKNAPTMKYDINDKCAVELANWMNSKNCPNAFNDEYTDKVARFVQNNLPILLLVWSYKLDENDAFHYFCGNMNLSELMDCCFDIPPNIQEQLVNAENEDEIHQICKDNNIYVF